MSPGLRDALRSVAGLVAGPAALFVTTEAGQILPYPECAGAPPLSLAVTLAGLAVSLLGSWISLGPIRRHLASGTTSPAAARSPYPHAFAFVALLGGLTGLVFAFVFALQATAAVMVPPCLR